MSPTLHAQPAAAAAPRIRAFFAAELGASARDAAAQLARDLRRSPGGSGVRWVRPAAYHLTLRFLGEVEEERLERLRDEASAAVAPLVPFTLQLAGLAGLPSLRRPRVIVVDVEPEAPLEELAARLEAAAVAAGLPAEKRRFRPHLTLGRVRERTAPRLEEAAAPAASPFDVTEVVLFQSRLSPGGAVYTPLSRLPLAGADEPAHCDSYSSRTRSFEGEEHGQERTQL